MAKAAIAKWIDQEADDYNNYFVGRVGFLIERSHNLKGWERYTISNYPPETNVSHQPKLWGWCGTYNDVGTYGHGMVRVEKIAKNGRVYIRSLPESELASKLEEFGFPEIA